LPKIVFRGSVFSGEGRGKKYVQLSWFNSQTHEKLGFYPYPGTLNIRLTEKDVEKRRLLETSEGFTVEPQAGYYSGILFRATINGLECGIVIPIMPNYPINVLEVIASIYLRGNLKLVDGDLVTVDVTV